ncbi:MAG: hypothetical protein ACSHX6_03755 [Akkermansiaceae bacterium]
MKLTTSITTLLALLTIPLLGKADENKITIKSITLKEGESIGEAIQKAIEETQKETEKKGKAKVKAPKKHTTKPEIKITTQGIEIIQDGKKQIIQLGGADIPENSGDTVNKDLNKAINKALKEAGKSNQTILIGPDGKKIPLNKGDTLADAINKLTKTGSPDQPGIARIGPAFVTGSADTTELKKEVSELKNELSQQRKLLEAILEKLK